MAYTFPNVPQAAGVPPLARITADQIGATVSQALSPNIGAVLTTGIATQITGAIMGQFNSFVGQITSSVLSSSVGQIVTAGTSVAAGLNVTTQLDASSLSFDDDPQNLQSADEPGVSTSTPSPQWGIFDENGNAVLVGDTTLSLEYMEEYRIADYPIEGGQFASYNKVKTPFAGRITFAQGGSSSDKTSFLNDVEVAIASTYSKYQLITPEVAYQNVNPIRAYYDRKAAQGVGLMRVEIEVREVRVAPDPAFTNVKSPASADQTNGGTVQATGTTHTYAQLQAAGPN